MNQNTSKNWFAITFLLVVAAIIALVAWLNFLKKRKVLKQEAAEKYGITTKVLANWIALICPLDMKKRYVDGKSKKVVLSELYEYLGKPEERPKTSRGKSIRRKDDFIGACGISQSELKRKLRAMESPHEKIGTSYEVYGKLRVLPPRHAKLILFFLISEGYRLH